MVGIVILDFNNAEETINCIESVIKHSKDGTFKIVVVENGSNEYTLQLIRSYIQKHFSGYLILTDSDSLSYPMPNITLLISSTNDGYARGNNKALKLLENDVETNMIMILNNDILFIEDIITPLSLYLQKTPNAGIVSPLLLKEDGKSIDYCCARRDYKKMHFFWEYLFLFVDFKGIIRRYYKKIVILDDSNQLSKELVEIELPSGACMMIQKNLFEQIGYFDSNTFLYFEENILYRKLLNLQKKNYLIPKCRCIHLGASTSKKTSSIFTARCQSESTVYYLRKYRHAPLLALFVNIMSHFVIFKIWIKGKVKKE